MLEEIAGRTEDVIDNQTTVVRTLKLIEADPTWLYGRTDSGLSVWPHAKSFLSVQYVKLRNGVMVERDERMYVCSLEPSRLTPSQWLLLVRSHWGVENNAHHTLDTAFAEDDRPWIEADPHGMLAVLILRRIAYTILTLYRAVTLRSDEGRATRWKALLQAVRDVLVAAAEEQLAGLHEVAAATR
jgi:hypothetical protein